MSLKILMLTNGTAFSNTALGDRKYHFFPHTDGLAHVMYFSGNQKTVL